MIDILMAVYNGEKYIEEQLDSIVYQTVSNWHLIILDDASTDDTAVLLRQYAARYPDRIEVHRNTENSGSAQNNFFNLIKYSTHNYVMFSDHDDVWEQNKIEKTYRRMLEIAESSCNPNTPLLVHTDLKVVDDKLKVINNSLFKMQNLAYSRDKLNNLLTQNIVTGCTMMVNRALLDMIDVIPKYAIMHDWWFALIACCFGKIGFVNDSTILYRQHSDNEVGAKKVRSLSYKSKKILHSKKTKSMVSDTYKQALEFYKIYSNILSNRQKKIIRVYSSIPKQSKLKRIKILFKYKFWKNGIARKVGQIFFA